MKVFRCGGSLESRTLKSCLYSIVMGSPFLGAKNNTKWNTKSVKVGFAAHLVDCLYSMHEALGSDPETTETRYGCTYF